MRILWKWLSMLKNLWQGENNMFWNKKENKIPEPKYEWKILGYGIMNNNGYCYSPEYHRFDKRG